MQAQIQAKSRASIAPASGQTPIAPFEYTQTRTVEDNRKHLRKQRVIAGMEPSAYVDAFKMLRTRILPRMREQGWNTLGVAGPNAGVGASLVAANLALSLALEVTQTVLLVDANMRDPGVHRLFGLRPEHGLADHLLDWVPVEKILVHPGGIDRLVLLPGNRSVPGSVEVLSSPATVGLVDELKHRYANRIVIFDLPPLQTADALAFAPRLDCLLLVVGAGSTQRVELSEALDSLQGVPVIGTVLNDAEVAAAD
jgi:Mrp family chromosome partitioning ATPase